ncbi:helix-turn-helix transcriptional regulator [Paenibacillus alkalitolerans]|uniref:helix-turn-helix transcriptional regulator n=1 Tax=Paenibacillus alkalitolerans TaxID=2799335 RepID=UPI0018F4368F|nr:helix-turn-helix transcriptional regulator [Paenibacillus alkalitolerans]
MSFLKALTGSYFTKLVLFGFFFATLPLLALGIYSYTTTFDIMQTQTKRENLQLTVQVRLTVEQVLETATHSVTHLLNSSLAERSLDTNFSGQDFRLYNDLTESLRHLQTFDTGIQDIVLMNERQHWVINNNGLFRWDDMHFANTYAGYMDASHDKYWTLRLNTPFPGQPVASDAMCNSHIDYVVKLPVNRYEKYGLAVTRIPVCEMLQLFPQTSHNRIYVLDETMRFIVADRHEMLGRAISDVFRFTEAPDFSPPQGYFTSKLGQETFVFTYNRSELNGWTYLSMTSLEQLTRESQRIGWLTVYLCLALLLGAGGIVCLISLRMYRPVRTLLRSVAPDDAGRALQRKHDEFQTIGLQFQRLHQIKDKLVTDLSTHVNHSKSYFLLQLYQGDIRPKEIEEKLHTFGFYPYTSHWNQMAVLTIQIDSLESTRYQEPDRSLLLFAVNNIIGELIPDSRRLAPTIIGESQVTLIGGEGEASGETDFSDRLEHDASSIQSTVRSYLGLSISVSISQPFQEFREAPRAFHEGLEALQHRMRLGNGAIIRYNSLPPNQKFAIAYPKRLEDSLTDAIRLMDKQKAHESLELLLGEIFTAERHPMEYQITLVRVLNQLIVLMQELGVSLNSVLRENESPYDRLFRLKTPFEIEAWLKADIVKPIMATLDERKSSQYKHLSERMIAMIHDEYDTDLTLEKCSKALHYNMNYLSGVFRKETGMSFSEYLSIYRLHMAKKWLTGTDMSIKEIAERLQYNNSQNFIRSFRKSENMTPGEYRKQTGHSA